MQNFETQSTLKEIMEPESQLSSNLYEVERFLDYRACFNASKHDDSDFDEYVILTKWVGYSQPAWQPLQLYFEDVPEMVEQFFAGQGLTIEEQIIDDQPKYRLDFLTQDQSQDSNFSLQQIQSKAISKKCQGKNLIARERQTYQDSTSQRYNSQKLNADKQLLVKHDSSAEEKGSRDIGSGKNEFVRVGGAKRQDEEAVHRGRTKNKKKSKSFKQKRGKDSVKALAAREKEIRREVADKIALLQQLKRSSSPSSRAQAQQTKKTLQIKKKHARTLRQILNKKMRNMLSMQQVLNKDVEGLSREVQELKAEQKANQAKTQKLLNKILDNQQFIAQKDNLELNNDQSSALTQTEYSE